MPIYRREVYGWEYSSRTPVSDDTAEAFSPDESDSLENREQKSSPDMCRGCNLFGELGSCVLSITVETDGDGNHIMVADCQGEPFTESRAEADRRKRQCNKVHRTLNESHSKYKKL